MQTILVIEDESDICELVRLNLERQGGYTVLTADNGNSGLDAARLHLPDLIILDLMLPGKDGFAVMKALRMDSRTQSIPVLMLTAKGALGDRIAGLEQGADDYVTKPFSPKELMLRVKALLKRTKRVVVDASLRDGDFLIDRNALKLFLAGNPVELTATEFKLLRLLMESAGTPVEREVLLREVWGYSDAILTRTLDTHVKRLREKLGTRAAQIETMRGIGYRFVRSPAAGLAVSG
ncbi:MAG: response regulator transcription factor [Verrucomicrobiales bacterium]|nr:response regulator transcription factor [Verrucomicrobiales bacterium]